MSKDARTSRLGLGKYNRGNSTWDPNFNADMDLLDVVQAPKNVFEVSPDFTDDLFDGGDPADRRQFDTIQGAIDAWEAAGYGDLQFGMIKVYPGRYEERLTITRSVALVAEQKHPLVLGNAAEGVYLRGDGSGNALFTFDPVDGETHSLIVDGFDLVNWSPTGAGVYPIAVLDARDQGAGLYGPYPHPIVFRDCTIRQSLNTSAYWYDAFRARAHCWLTMQDCRGSFPSDHTGGNYMRFPFLIVGNTATGKPARLSVHGGAYTHYNFTGTGSYTIYVQEAGSSVLAHRATFSRTPANGLYGLLSGCTATGLAAAEAAAYGNLFGIDVAEF